MSFLTFYLYSLLILLSLNAKTLTTLYTKEVTTKSLKVLVNDLTIGCIDPKEAKHDYEFWILKAFYNGLIKNDGLNVLNRDAALSFNMNYNKKSLFIKLNPNNKWSDGTSVVAYDYLYSWNRLKQTKNTLAIEKINSLNLKKNNNTKLKSVINYILRRRIVDIEVLSKFELRLNFQTPMDREYLIGVLSHPLFFPVHRETIKNINNKKSQLNTNKIITNGLYTPVLIKQPLLIRAIPNIHYNKLSKDYMHKQQKLDIVTKQYINNDYTNVDIIEHSVIAENDLIKNKVTENDNFKLIENYATKYLYLTVDLHNIDLIHRKSLTKAIYLGLDRDIPKLLDKDYYSRKQEGFFLKTNKYAPLIPKDIISNSEKSISMRSGKLLYDWIKNNKIDKLNIYVLANNGFKHKEWILKSFRNLNKYDNVNIEFMDNISLLKSIDNEKCVVLHLKELIFNSKNVEEQNNFYVDLYLNIFMHERLKIAKLYNIIKLYNLSPELEDRISELKNFESILLDDLPCIPFMQASKLFLIKPNIKLSTIYDTYGYPIWKHIYNINLDKSNQGNEKVKKSNSFIAYIKKKFTR